MLKRVLVAGLLSLMTTFQVNGAHSAEPPTANPLVVLETTQGEITLKLFPEAAPKAVENFLTLVGKGYYDGTKFHRIISGFMVQGGDPTATGSGGQSAWGEDFEDEFTPSLRFDRPGLLAMANRGPSTNGSQFFITLAPTPHLNDRHTIFGEVIFGTDVLQKLGAVQTSPDDRPVSDQKIDRAVVK